MREFFKNFFTAGSGTPVAGGVNFWVEWGHILVFVAVWVAVVLVVIFLIHRIGYRIGPKHLKVTLLGIPIRRVRLDNIRNISTRRVRFVEKWRNQVFLRHDRILVIEKRRGLIKNFMITPEQRYVFKAELDRAIRSCMGLPPGPTAADNTTFERMQDAAEAETARKPSLEPPAPESHQS